MRHKAFIKTCQFLTSNEQKKTYDKPLCKKWSFTLYTIIICNLNKKNLQNLRFIDCSLTAFRGDFCSTEIFHQIVIGEEPSNSTSSFYRANADIGTGYHRLELSPSDSTLRFNRRIFVVYWLRIQNLCLNVYVNLVYLTPITSFKFYFAIESL